MKLFVFEDVLYDWSSGMVVIAAKDLRQARKLAEQEFSKRTMEEGGWKKPAGSYHVDDKVKPGVKHYAYGGG